jgi:cold-inducible RNA-binding protein
MKLYVGNLSFETSEADLRSIFEQFGNVTEIHLVSDRETGRSRGFAFVTMSNAAEGRAAIGTLHGKQFGGRALTVNEARPREDRPKQSFSRRPRQ